MLDASRFFGFGVFFRGHWCAETWPVDWFTRGMTRDLTFLELFPIHMVVCLWGKDMMNHTVHFWCDNLGVVHVVNSLTSRLTHVMGLVRKSVLLCLHFNILFLARHVPGCSNRVADALSHQQMLRFRELAPGANPSPVRMPPDLWLTGK